MKKNFKWIIYSIFIVIFLFPFYVFGTYIPPGGGGGDIVKSGVPSIHQIGIWTADGVLKGLTVTGSKVMCTDADGEPIACTNLTDIVPATTSTKLDDFGTPDDNTHLNATITYHGLLPKLNNDPNTWLNGQGGWSLPPGSGDVTGVGNCASGDCLDGTVDGGTEILFYDPNGATTLAVGNTTGPITLTLPIITGTLLTSQQIDTAAELETVANLGAYASDMLAATNEANFKSITNLEAGTDVLAPDGNGASLTNVLHDLSDDATPTLGGNLGGGGYNISNLGTISQTHATPGFVGIDSTFSDGSFNFYGDNTDADNATFLFRVQHGGDYKTYLTLNGVTDATIVNSDLYLTSGLINASGTVFKDHFSFSFLNPTAADDLPLGKVSPYASMTVTGITGVCYGGSPGNDELVGDLYICDGDGTTSCAAVNGSVMTFDGGEDSYAAPAGTVTGVTAERFVWLSDATTKGSPGYCTVSVAYTYVP